ncbi:MAG: insulinase family protein [Treponema sp.]|nr:insulinase family protein [Treponema sp.]
MNTDSSGEAAVKTNLSKGQTLESGFRVLDTVDLREIKAAGIWAKHEKSGAEVFHILNDDSENLFSFTFQTVPKDSTGAAHILEHTVLCGSERYPLKDSFIVLAQGSLQTFLNALTYPDKTSYPASSTNEHDYFNLMSVYGDAVFRPLLHEWTFTQEGHRLEYADGKLSVTGVVYNEMKGAYSSLDAYAGLWSVKAVMPGTPYALESGGDPEEIINLTLEGLKEFHRAHYSPANCKIFLAGNIPTEKQLAFLNDEFFSLLPGGAACGKINKTERWTEHKKFHLTCPAGSGNKATVFLSWLCCDVTDSYETLALAVLTEILLGHDGSPLTRALVESGLGEDITPVSGLEGDIREVLFVAGLKSVGGDIEKKSEEVENLITGVFKKLVSEGIPPGEIEAALLSVEFSQKEIRRSGGPFSLVWMRRCLRSWIHGGRPWDSLLVQGLFSKLKENIASFFAASEGQAKNCYFETLIQKYFLDNPHRALVILEPKDDFLSKQEEKLSQSLKKTEENLSAGDRKKIKEKSKLLEKIQSEADTLEALASIPHLSRSDLSFKEDVIPRAHVDLKGVPALCHDLFTNGITYIDFAFPVDIFPLDEYPWLQFFSRAVSSVGLPGMDYGEVSSLMARTAGGFISLLHTGSAVKNAPNVIKTACGDFDLCGRDWIIFRLRCLDEKIAPSLDLALRVISEADFNDRRRINDLILEMKNEADSSLAPMGHIYSSCRSGRFISRSKTVEEKWGGISQIDFIHCLVNTEIDSVINKLKYIRDKITAGGLFVNITGSAANADKEIANRFAGFGPPKRRLDSNLNFVPVNDFQGAEVFSSKSLQVGFAALTFNSAPFDTIEQTAESVLAHQLTTGALWENIRMKGGAYGAFASPNSLENTVSLITYRDPNPLRSLDFFSSMFKKKSFAECTEDFLEKSIIGCFSKETRPQTPAEDGLVDFFRFLYGIDNDYRGRKLERLVSLSVSDILSAHASLGTRKPFCPVIIAGEKKAKDAAKALKVDAQTLPM